MMSDVQQLPSPGDPAGEKPLEGIAGWLIIVAIGQIAGPIAFILGTRSLFASLPEGTARDMPVAFLGAVLLELTVLGLLVFTAFLFFNKKSAFPKLFIATCILNLLEPLALALWLKAVVGGNVLAYVDTATVGQYVLSCVVAAIWISYVVNSVRVRNTFVH
ncbi:DUF2569 family protein [Phreatobacter stygius]|uniref:DUF2569 domain-containing protein n=1 Tax=Phreatobacter stygius TaxID=1940610 RepID=A0A4D7BH11_9HYPH|nr:DUF2569 family protein [Phreatobacter stygius]QCI67152.1 DUF2569 domain-containing protein [Phreatobacter stygius]